MSRITFDAEKVTFNLAKLKKGGENFEVAIDPDLIVNYKEGKKVDIKDILKSEKIFSDVKKGLLASVDVMKDLFGTSDIIKVSKIIFDLGEIQFTQEYRQKLQDEKRRKIIQIIHRRGIDPKTGSPHPLTRIENAFEEVKVRIDYFKGAEEQVEGIIKLLRVVLPIRFETKKIEVIVEHEYASKVYSMFPALGKIIEQDWLGNGGLRIIVEMPAGMVNDFFDKLNNVTHGQNETRNIGE